MGSPYLGKRATAVQGDRILGEAEKSPGAQVVCDGDPQTAAAQMLDIAKECLLKTGTAMGVLSFNTAQGQVMVMPGFEEKLDPSRLAAKARGYIRELEATRAAGTCSAWLVPRNMPEPAGGRRWRKAYQRGRRPALVGMCADRDQGVATLVRQVHEGKDGKPVGLSQPQAGLDTAAVHIHALGMITALYGLPADTVLPGHLARLVADMSEPGHTSARFAEALAALDMLKRAMEPATGDQPAAAEQPTTPE